MLFGRQRRERRVVENEAHAFKESGGFVCDARPLCVSGRCSGPPCVYADDFEDGDSVGWAAIEQTAATPGIWTVASEIGHTGATTLDFQQTGTANSYHYQYVPGVGPLTDQTISVWLKPGAAFSDDNHKAGVCARFTTGGVNTNTSTYCLFLRQDAGAAVGRLQISKKASTGFLSGLVSTTTPTFPGVTIPTFAVGTWYKVTLQVSGATQVTLIASINDVPLLSLVDDAATAAVPPLAGGSAGVVARQVPVSFDDVLVTSP